MKFGQPTMTPPKATIPASVPVVNNTETAAATGSGSGGTTDVSATQPGSNGALENKPDARNSATTAPTASNQPTTLTFDPVHSAQVRLDMTSPAPGTAAGFLQIVELHVLSSGVAIV